MQKKTIGMLMLAGTLLGAAAQTDQVKAATPPNGDSIRCVDYGG